MAIMNSFNKPKLEYSNDWSELTKFANQFPQKTHLIIFDKNIPLGIDFKNWTSENLSLIPFAVSGGEELKSIDNFAFVMKEILSKIKGVGPQDLIIYGIGGGTVGDFSGFVASVLKRGVRLVHVPTTWLAAIDSSHGGKTALNVGSFKNQIGTFYQAEAIFIIKSILQTQGEELEKSALGELFKMILLKGGELAIAFFGARKRGGDLIWDLLPLAVDGKYDFVSQDPFEKTGHRQYLNLGHSFGHVIELDRGVPHGLAVLIGIDFALKWSLRKGHLSSENFSQVTAKMEEAGVSQQIAKLKSNLLQEKGQLPETEVLDRIMQDKKCTLKGNFYFIFLKSIGNCLREEVTASSMLEELQQQGWIAANK